MNFTNLSEKLEFYSQYEVLNRKKANLYFDYLNSSCEKEGQKRKDDYFQLMQSYAALIEKRGSHPPTREQIDHYFTPLHQHATLQKQLEIVR